MKKRNLQGMLIFGLISHFGRNFKPQFGIHLKLPNYLSFRLFLSGFKGFTHFIFFSF